MVNKQRREVRVWVRRLVVATFACLPLTTGCLMVDVTERTEFGKVERMPVKFQSVRAAQDFQDGLRHSDQEAYTDIETLVMPFVAARRSEVYHRVEHYNAEVRLADVNGDGEVTEEEAREYGRYRQKAASSESDEP